VQEQGCPYSRRVLEVNRRRRVQFLGRGLELGNVGFLKSRPNSLVFQNIFVSETFYGFGGHTPIDLFSGLVFRFFHDERLRPCDRREARGGSRSPAWPDCPPVSDEYGFPQRSGDRSKESSTTCGRPSQALRPFSGEMHNSYSSGWASTQVKRSIVVTTVERINCQSVVLRTT
jgi:hypothetical protein